MYSSAKALVFSIFLLRTVVIAPFFASPIRIDLATLPAPITTQFFPFRFVTSKTDLTKASDAVLYPVIWFCLFIMQLTRFVFSEEESIYQKTFLIHRSNLKVCYITKYLKI